MHLQRLIIHTFMFCIFITNFFFVSFLFYLFLLDFLACFTEIVERNPFIAFTIELLEVDIVLIAGLVLFASCIEIWINLMDYLVRDDKPICELWTIFYPIRRSLHRNSSYLEPLWNLKVTFWGVQAKFLPIFPFPFRIWWCAWQFKQINIITLKKD